MKNDKYWLSKEGRKEIKEIWDDTEDGDVVRVLLDRVEQLESVIKRSINIAPCWLPGPEENINQENIGEAQALMNMYNEFKSLIKEY